MDRRSRFRLGRSAKASHRGPSGISPELRPRRRLRPFPRRPSAGAAVAATAPSSAATAAWNSARCCARPRRATPPFSPTPPSVNCCASPAPDDERDRRPDARTRPAAVRAAAGGLAEELRLPLELLDVEVLLDGEHAVLHLLRFGDCDVRPFVSARVARVRTAHSLDGPRPAGGAEPEEEHAGCGREGCGQEGGGCGSCGPRRLRFLRDRRDRRTPKNTSPGCVRRWSGAPPCCDFLRVNGAATVRERGEV